MRVECHVADTRYRDLQDTNPELEEGSFLLLQRGPANVHDEFAIKILNDKSHPLSYIPRIRKEALAHLMVAGKILSVSGRLHDGVEGQNSTLVA